MVRFHAGRSRDGAGTGLWLPAVVQSAALLGVRQEGRRTVSVVMAWPTGTAGVSRVRLIWLFAGILDLGMRHALAVCKGG